MADKWKVSVQNQRKIAFTHAKNRMPQESGSMKGKMAQAVCCGKRLMALSGKGMKKRRERSISPALCGILFGYGVAASSAGCGITLPLMTRLTAFR